MTALEIAEKIAREAHAGQTEESTGEPYIRHIERVVEIVKGDTAKAIAWLHDVLEDTPVTAAALVAAGVPLRIVRAVALLTRIESDTYADYIQKLKDSHDLVAIDVKIADLIDHFRPNCPPRLLPRYVKAWRVLAPTLPLPRAAVRHAGLLPRSKYPLTIDFLHPVTRAIVHSIRVEAPADGTLEPVYIPPVALQVGHPVRVRVTFADGTVEDEHT